MTEQQLDPYVQALKRELGFWRDHALHYATLWRGVGIALRDHGCLIGREHPDGLPEPTWSWAWPRIAPHPIQRTTTEDAAQYSALYYVLSNRVPMRPDSVLPQLVFLPSTRQVFRLAMAPPADTDEIEYAHLIGGEGRT